MIRLILLCVLTFPGCLYYYFKIRYVDKHDDKYDEERRYKIVTHMMKTIVRFSFVKVEVEGLENLPEEGGYVLYPNHQGKFDSLAISYCHKKPVTVVMDAKRSNLPFANELIMLTKGKRLDKDDYKQQMSVILEVIQEVKHGRRYIIFPEGRYDHNHNHVQELLPGSFKCSTKSKTPIVPVALIDTYKPFELNSIRPVKVKVCYLKPIEYEQYKNMTTKEISDIVKDAIERKIKEVEDDRNEEFNVEHRDICDAKR